MFLAQGEQLKLLVPAHQREESPDLEAIPNSDKLLRELWDLEAARGVARLEQDKLNSPIPFRCNLSREHTEWLEQRRGAASSNGRVAESILDLPY